MRSRRVPATAIAMALSAATLAQGIAHADPRPRDIAVGTRLAARTNPAVQLIGMSYSGTVMVPSPVPTAAFTALFAKAEKHAKAGRIPADHQSQVKWVLRTASRNVGKYLVPGKPARKAATEVSSICTGWWITPDGYMVSGAHCVATDNTLLRQRFAELALPKVIEVDVRGFLKSVAGFAQPDDGMAKLARTLFTAYDLKAMRVTGVRKRLAVKMHDGKGRISVRALGLVAKGSDYPGVDFALLRMKGARNLPTLSLGRDGDVRVGDYLYISGFPGITVFNATLDERSRMYPSLTEGAYNVKRTTVSGVPYLQAQAPSYGGNSGGPVFSKEGKVVGTLVAGARQVDGADTENASFVLPVGVIRKRLAAAGVAPVMSETSKVYDAALDDYFAGRNSRALERFLRVRELYPAHPYVGAFITELKSSR
ncbi:serine protease [Nonomuraea dietziae]|uniref:serine protease n=1 Tax=Nonomuraea dietziae TaxID=65515 RepID=UPI0033EA4B67